MKQMFLIISLSFFNLALLASGQANDPYSEAMKAALESLDNAKSTSDFIEVSNKFARIAEVEKEKWLPGYYAAYALTVSAATETDPKSIDGTLDKAQTHLDKISDLDKNESEYSTLQGFVYMIRIGVDPANRGQQYSGKSMQALQKAKVIDENNPRTLYMLAQLSMGTAQFFGNDFTEACGLNQKALELFELQKSKDDFNPKWGHSMSKQFQGRCG